MDNNSEVFQIRQALLQAAMEDYEEALINTPSTPAHSPAYRRWEKRLLRNPTALLHRQSRAPWAKALRMAACLLLAVCLSFVTVLATSAQAREWVARWIVRESATHNSYDFQGPAPADQMATWAPTYLPEGYTQTRYNDLENLVDIFYGTDNPDLQIHFSYQRLASGRGERLDNEHYTISDIFINGIYGQLYTASDNYPNMIVWFDESAGYSFFLAARLPVDELVKIAECVQNTES